jgi:hypothetical protein
MISSADLIDQISLSTGIGDHYQEPIKVDTFNPEWFRCKDSSVDTDIQAGMNVKVTDSARDRLFIVDSFYGAKALAIKTDPGAEYYKRFRLGPGTELHVNDGPYCYGESTWWLVITQDTSSTNSDIYLFGLIPEMSDGVKLLEAVVNGAE